MRALLLAFASTAAITATSLHAAPASACSPAANYSAGVASSDAPACLVMSARGGDSSSSLYVTNDCTTTVTLAAGADCPTCGAEIAVAPGTEGEMVIETERTSGKRTVLWSQPAEGGGGGDAASGTIVVDVAWVDNSGACDDFNEENDDGDDDGGSGDGCSVGTLGRGAGDAAGVAALGAGLVATRRRRRRA